jgi:hypothetical protein
MDCCYSASGTRSSSDSTDDVRSVRPRSNFKLYQRLSQEWIFPSNGGLQSHILLTACGSSAAAWESNGRGVFTVALLELLNDSRIDKLRYCDIIMRMYIDPKYVYNLSVKVCHTDTVSPHD